MVVIHCSDTIALGALVRRTRLSQVHECSRPDSVTVLHQLELLFCLGAVLFLERDSFFRSDESEISSGDISGQRQLPRSHAVARVGPAGHRLLQPLLARESV